MPKRSSTPRRDLNQIAYDIVRRVTEGPQTDSPQKNPAAVALGRLGGLKGGKARAAALSKKQRADIAKKAAEARWGKSKR